MAIGQRRPIVFKAAVFAEEEGGTSSESYVDAARVFAVVNQRSSNRNKDGDQVQMRTVYNFSEIRFSENFTPVKTMLISYNGLLLTIESIIVKENKTPYYYTINAVDNG